MPIRQSVGDYIEAFHARNGLSRDRMSAEAADEFDRELRVITEPFQDGGRLTLGTVGLVVWGRPLVPARKSGQ